MQKMKHSSPAWLILFLKQLKSEKLKVKKGADPLSKRVQAQVAIFNSPPFQGGVRGGLPLLRAKFL